MAIITITNLDEETARRLRIRAAEKGLSVEEVARDSLQRLYGGEVPPAAASEDPENWVDGLVRRMQEIGDAELELPERGPSRPPPDFSKW